MLIIDNTPVGGREMEQFKYIVIGFGKGGKTLAKTMTSRGESVLVIEEDSKMYGGTCINVGCIPSKKLIVEGDRHVPIEEAALLKSKLIGALNQKNYHMIADEPTAQVWNGRGRFVDNYTLEVAMVDGTTRMARGEHIIINTGAKSIIPNLSGLDVTDPRVLTSKEALALDEQIEQLVIIGAGYIGLEFAGMMANFKISVTVIDTNPTFMGREDSDVAAIVKKDLEDAGVTFLLGVKELSFSHSQDGITVKADGEPLKASRILLATGRRPNTDDLGLENTDIKVNNCGAIVVNEQLQTGVPNVWAVGDVNGGPQFTYISLDDFRIVMDQLQGTGVRRTTDRQWVPYTVFLLEPFSRVGLTEAEAIAKGLSFVVKQLPVAGIPKAHILGHTRGVFKVLVDPTTEYILGATLYGAESHEIINLITLAMNHNIPATALKNGIYTHPTMVESLNDLFK